MSDVYLRAAELVDAKPKNYPDGLPSCVAISQAKSGCIFGEDGYEERIPERTDYAKTFNFDPSGHCWELEDMGREERKQCRVLALLFMHAIVNYKERSRP